MTAQHTPGPWVLVNGENFMGNPMLEIKADKESLMCDEPYYPSTPTNKADWTLMAAAPELLEALHKVNASCPGGIKPTDDGAVLVALTVAEVKFLRAAILKATGVAQ